MIAYGINQRRNPRTSEVQKKFKVGVVVSDDVGIMQINDKLEIDKHPRRRGRRREGVGYCSDVRSAP